MRSTLFALLAFGFAAGGLAAADPEPATVSGTGAAEIRRPAEVLRVQFEAMARGKNLADAMDKLKARRELVAAELVKFGAGKDAVAFGDPDVVDEAADRADQVGRMVAARNRALGKSPKPKTEAPTVLSVTVKVDFPLPADNPEGRLVAARTLQERIKAADLGGLKTDGKVSPEEEELAEESVGPNHRMGMGDEQPRGAPTFLYVAKLGEADRKKALAEAFANARRDARRLAEAAGMDLGGLHRLVDQSQSGGDLDELMAMRRSYGYGRFGGGNPGAVLVGEEIIGMSPGKVVAKVGVVAQFKLMPAK